MSTTSTRTYHDTYEHDWFRVQDPLRECRSIRAFLVFHITAHLTYAFLMYGVVAINKQKYLHVAAAATYVACRECATLAREVLAA